MEAGEVAALADLGEAAYIAKLHEQVLVLVEVRVC